MQGTLREGSTPTTSSTPPMAGAPARSPFASFRFVRGGTRSPIIRPSKSQPPRDNMTKIT